MNEAITNPWLTDYSEAQDRIERALDVMLRYGRIDGGDRKMWVIDQAVKALAGDQYDRVIAEYCDGEDGPETYDWESGIPP